MTARPADEDVEAAVDALAFLSMDSLETPLNSLLTHHEHSMAQDIASRFVIVHDAITALSSRLSAAVEGQAAAEQNAADAETARDWAMTRVVRLADATQAAWRELQRARDARANRTGIIGNATLILERELVVVDPSLREAAQEPDTLAETLAALAEDFHVVGEGGVHIGSCPGCRAFLALAAARAGEATEEKETAT